MGYLPPFTKLLAAFSLLYNFQLRLFFSFECSLVTLVEGIQNGVKMKAGGVTVKWRLS